MIKSTIDVMYREIGVAYCAQVQADEADKHLQLPKNLKFYLNSAYSGPSTTKTGLSTSKTGPSTS